MHRIASIILVLAWGLWFGGLIALFIAVASLFSTFADHHDFAGLAASRIFRLFNLYQYGLAGIALLAAIVCRMVRGSRASSSLLILLGAATAIALTISLWLTPMIEQLRVLERTHTAEFAQLHGRSMLLSTVEALVLLLAGLTLPFVLDRRR